MNYNKKAQEIWNASKSLGEITAVSLIEKELRDAVFSEREEIIETVSEKLSPKQVQFRFMSYLLFIFYHKRSIQALIQVIRANVVSVIRKRSYN